MKPLVIYHDNCADGFGAAFAAWLYLKDTAEYVPMQYGFHVDDLDNLALDNNIVYMVDFSWPKPLMDGLFERAKYVVWLDHHKTAFEAYGLIPNGSGEPPIKQFGVLEQLLSRHEIILDNNRSGAMVAWEYFHPNTEVPMLIKYIDDYDRWQFKIEGTKEFNKALWSYAPWSFEWWDDLYTRESYPETEAGSMVTFKQEGAAILRAHDQNVRAVVKGSARECKISFHESGIGVVKQLVFREGLAANCPPHLASDVGHQLANKSGTYGLLWHINKEGKCQCSLRSNGDYDVSAIAKNFGGGGHKNAAGFEVPIETILWWIA